MTNASYIIEVDPETDLLVSIKMTVLAGRRGATEWQGKKITGGEHVAFHFKYTFSDYDKVEPLKIPPEAWKLLAKR